MPLATVSRPNHRRKPQSGEAKQIGAISREVSRQYTESGETVAVTVQRRYDADQADVWQAITDPERVRRWFLPVTGDLREGGNFQLEGNASGDIMTCEPPRHLMVTFGGESSIVDVLLSDDGQQTLLKLTHSVPIELAGSGPAPSTSDLAGTEPCSASRCILPEKSPGTRSLPPTVRRCRNFNVTSISQWVATIEASGTADADAISAAQQVSLGQFAPDLVRPE
jgi:uncharacterized protein YndB with AHSA1/START domain